MILSIITVACCRSMLQQTTEIDECLNQAVEQENEKESHVSHRKPTTSNRVHEKQNTDEEETDMDEKSKEK